MNVPLRESAAVISSSNLKLIQKSSPDASPRPSTVSAPNFRAERDFPTLGGAGGLGGGGSGQSGKKKSKESSGIGTLNDVASMFATKAKDTPGNNNNNNKAVNNNTGSNNAAKTGNNNSNKAGNNSVNKENHSAVNNKQEVKQSKKPEPQSEKKGDSKLKKVEGSEKKKEKTEPNVGSTQTISNSGKDNKSKNSGISTEIGRKAAEEKIVSAVKTPSTADAKSGNKTPSTTNVTAGIKTPSTADVINGNKTPSGEGAKKSKQPGEKRDNADKKDESSGGKRKEKSETSKEDKKEKKKDGEKQKNASEEEPVFDFYENEPKSTDSLIKEAKEKSFASPVGSTASSFERSSISAPVSGASASAKIEKSTPVVDDAAFPALQPKAKKPTATTKTTTAATTTKGKAMDKKSANEAASDFMDWWDVDSHKPKAVRGIMTWNGRIWT